MAESHIDTRGFAGPPLRAAATLLVMLTGLTILSQLFRASPGVIAPELIRDLSLSPEGLGLASGSFFLALMAAQIPVGVLFDRIGPRYTVGLLIGFAVVGALLHAYIETGKGLIGARALLGLGSAASFMAAIVLCSRWYPPERWATVLSWVFASSQLGFMLAGTPLAYASETIGWRQAFVIMAIATAVIGVLFVAIVRDDPPGHAIAKVGRGKSEVGAIAGILAVLRLPGLWRVLALQTVAYGVFSTVAGLWAGPYLHDVHGLDPVARGNVLVAMVVAQTIGTLTFGPLDRRFNSRKWVAVAGAIVTLALLAALALVAKPPLWLAIGLLMALALVSSYGVVVVTHARAHYPEHLAGRGVTTANMAQIGGTGFVPILTGLIPGLFPMHDGGYAVAAYQGIFATIFAALTIGLVIYLTSDDKPPRA